jgi:hypothetical protein
VSGSWQRPHVTSWQDRVLPSFWRLYRSASEIVGRRTTILLACLAVVAVLLITPAIRIALLFSVVGAGLALFLQDVIDPTPLFWVAPWEALHLLGSRRLRVNHLWLHRTQKLVCNSVDSGVRPDGFATRDGFFLASAGHDQVELQRAAELAWSEVNKAPQLGGFREGCKTMRFLLTSMLIAASLLILLSVWRGVSWPTLLLLAATGGAVGHALAGPVERMLAPWASSLVRPEKFVRPYCIEVRQAALTGIVWFKGCRGFWVRQLGPEWHEGGDDN